MVAIYIPPERKYNPTINGIIIWLFLVNLEVINALDNVPIEWAKNGNIKYLKSQFIAFIESKVSDGGKMNPPIIINPILIIIPIIIPKIRIVIFFKDCFIIKEYINQ